MRWLAALCALAACGHAAERHDDVPPDDEVWLSADQMKKADIQVAQAAARDMAQDIVVGGRVAFDDLHVTHVFSPVSGRVTRVLARAGQKVEKGTPLVAILSPDVGSAFADLVKAQADLSATEADFHRESRLLADDATSARAKEAAEDSYRKAQAEYARAQQRAALLRAGALDAVTQEYVLRSYTDGWVIARSVNPGAEVVGQYSGGNTNELFTVGDIKDVWVYADVPDLDLPRVQLGADVAIKVIAYPDRVFHGKVDWIANTVDPNVRTARIRAVLPNQTEELKPEMFATVAIAQPPQHRLAVPAGALVHINESTFVFVADGTRPDGRQIFKRRPVTAGDERDGFVPVSDGLTAGERVVTQGSLSRDQPNDEVWPTPEQIEEARLGTAKVEQRDINDAVTIGGRLTFDDTQISHVFSPVNGRITKVLAQLGQRVEKGTPLVAISSPDVAKALADEAAARADLTQAQHELERQKELFDANATSRHDLEAAEDAFEKAQAEYERTHQLTEILHSGSVDEVTQDYVLRSPIAGEVIARTAHPGLEIQGQYSNGSNVVELFTIGETDPLWVLGDVYEMDLPHVNEGDDVTIKVGAYPDRVFHGKVDWVADVLDPQAHTAKVRCIIENADHLLKPEMYEAVDISVPGKQMMVVPRDALMRVEGDTIVFVETGERRSDGGVVFKARKVVAKLDEDAPMVPVLSGLAAGETVVTDHSIMLLGML